MLRPVLIIEQIKAGAATGGVCGHADRTLDELFGESKPTTRSKRGPAPQWQQHIEAVAQLPKSQQQFVSKMIETVLAQQGR